MGHNAPPAAGGASAHAEAIERDGISQQSASRYQALAAVPAEVFDEAIRNPDASPTVRGLVEQARDPVPQIHREVLWIWGAMCEFERCDYASQDPKSIYGQMTEPMREDVRRLAPVMVDFLNRMKETI